MHTQDSKSSHWGWYLQDTECRPCIHSQSPSCAFMGPHPNVTRDPETEHCSTVQRPQHGEQEHACCMEGMGQKRLAPWKWKLYKGRTRQGSLLASTKPSLKQLWNQDLFIRSWMYGGIGKVSDIILPYSMVSYKPSAMQRTGQGFWQQLALPGL